MSTLHHFPEQSAPFIGRQQEVAEVVRLLAEPTCRLITLVGPGGMGKTRLAIAAATASSFADGIFFVPMQPVPDVRAALAALADALHLPLTSHASPAHQLHEFLHDKELLLLLDNVEHLLEGIDWLSTC